jgi:aspartyl-tRNA(Asn)/glutamyl-tRNA(Gln) amidotransferase subunit B
VQETRNYDDSSGSTTSMRSKEEAHDYRYFPEPDLLPLKISDEWLNEIKRSQPKLPDEIKSLLGAAGLPDTDVTQLLDDPLRYYYFDAVCAVAASAAPKKIANWVLGDLSALANEGKFNFEKPAIAPATLAELLQMIEAGSISGKIAKEILPDLLGGQSPQAVLDAKGLKQISQDGDIVPVIEKVVRENPGPLEQFKKGKHSVTGFFVGQVMKATKGQAKPDVVNKLVREVLERF